jgi:hypothetical protein
MEICSNLVGVCISAFTSPLVVLVVNVPGLCCAQVSCPQYSWLICTRTNRLSIHILVRYTSPRIDHNQHSIPPSIHPILNQQHEHRPPSSQPQPLRPSSLNPNVPFLPSNLPGIPLSPLAFPSPFQIPLVFLSPASLPLHHILLSEPSFS